MKFAEKAIDSRASDTINRGIDLVWWSLKTKKNKKKETGGGRRVQTIRLRS